MNNCLSQSPKWSPFAIVVTILIVVGMFALIVSIDRWPQWRVPFIIVLACMFIITVAAAFFSPTRIILTDSNLIIKFSLRSKAIPLTEIKSAVPYQRTMNFVRTFGSGGYYGWWGRFRNQELGRFFVYATNLRRLILITTDSGRKYLISCSDPASFLDRMQKPEKFSHPKQA